MANCNDNFQKGKNSFLSKITLEPDKKEHLRVSRDRLRKKIKKKLQEKGAKNIRFRGQGSYAHGTLIAPLDGDYDIDDGVYMDLSGFEKEPATTTIHNWIKEAAKGHTKENPMDKEACVRAIFKADYHVDLPAYKTEKEEGQNDTYYLAKKIAGWEESNPKGMTYWFKEKVKEHTEQVRRIVKYFKAWKDYRNSKTSTKLPNGLTLTILACEEFMSDPRDDIAFCETARNILSRLGDDDNDTINKPYEPTENMRDYLSDTQFDHFLSELRQLIDTGEDADDEESQSKAANKWQAVLGDRFPILEESDSDKSEAKAFAGPTIIGSTYRGANRGA